MKNNNLSSKYRKKTFRLIIVVLTAAFCSCNIDRTPVNIKGHAEGLDGVIRITTGDSVLLAESIKKDGSFSIEGIINEPGFYILELFENGKSDKYEFLVYLNQDPVQINFDAGNPKNYPEVSGRSKHHAEISKYYAKLNPVMKVADIKYHQAKNMLEQEQKRTVDSGKVVKLIEAFAVIERRRKTIRSDVRENYIVNNPSSLLSGYLITQSGSEIINKPALYNDLYENLSQEVKNSTYGKEAAALIKDALNRREPRR